MNSKPNLHAAISAIQSLTEIVAQEASQTASSRPMLVDAVNKLRRDTIDTLAEAEKKINIGCDELITAINDELSSREAVLQQITSLQPAKEQPSQE